MKQRLVLWRDTRVGWQPVLREDLPRIENIENAEENINMGDATKTKVLVPEQYANKIKIWDKSCELKEDQKASVLWLNLPDNHPSDIKDKIYNEMEDDLSKEGGMTKFIKIMEKAFKPAKQNKVYQTLLTS